MISVLSILLTNRVSKYSASRGREDLRCQETRQRWEWEIRPYPSFRRYQIPHRGSYPAEADVVFR